MNIRSFLNSILASALAVGLVLPVCAQTFNGQQLQGRVTYVPTGTTVDAVLTSPVDSGVAKPGDLFNAKLYAPLYLGNEVVLPANTTLEGQVTAAEKSGHLGGNGLIGMRLTAAVTPDGVRYPLSALITANQTTKVNEDNQGNLHGRSKKATVTSGVARTAAWTAGGTLLGVIFAPIVAGAVGAGAVAGVATGGAVGLGSNLWRKGKDVKIPSGTRLTFALDQPLSLTTGIAGNGNNYTR
jgi:hypothetical protein